ncbi:hypothetical protein EDD18DRAFT_1187410 [Armillaria luteobubalina]|uniref:Uncharacterized protein n=1 Tax=Armillaria luteobubalina TaxID=153913 RepID=A0AA39UHR3_9AGAR|nr:hypothetical protein EDD18DRAFT_1187410 [Armillaria luteobubalina]
MYRPHQVLCALGPAVLAKHVRPHIYSNLFVNGTKAPRSSHRTVFPSISIALVPILSSSCGSTNIHAGPRFTSPKDQSNLPLILIPNPQTPGLLPFSEAPCSYTYQFESRIAQGCRSHTIINFLTFPRLESYPLFQGYAITKELLEYQALAGDGLERGSLLVRSYLVPDTCVNLHFTRIYLC